MKLSKTQKRIVEKKEQIKNKIIIAVDPGSKKHQVEILSPEVMPIMRSFSIFNSGEGFKKLARKISGIKKEYPRIEMVFAIEPSSHYWLNLLFFFKKRGYIFYLVPGLFVKRSREIEDHTPRQDDPKDAHIIGELASRGKYSIEHQPQVIFAELRNLSDAWLEISQEMVRHRLRMRAILDKYFPEFLRLFSDFLGTTARFLLSKCPFPFDVVQEDIENLTQEAFRISRSMIDIKIISTLHTAAISSVGIEEGVNTAKIRLNQYLEKYELCKRQQKQILSQIRIYLKRVEYTPYLLSLPGVGYVSISILLGQTGDLLGYNSVADLMSYAGLDLIYCDSGNKRGSRRISKRGRPKLRLILFRITLGFIRYNNIARRKYLKQRLAEKPGTQAITSSISFFVRIMFSVVRERRAYKRPDISDPLVKEIQELEIDFKKKYKKAA
jgi:transposase